MQAKLLFYSCFTMLSICQTLSLHCFIMSYITHKQDITLLGDQHPRKSNQCELEHLKAIIYPRCESPRRHILLIEDCFASLSRKLKEVSMDSSDSVKVSLLNGLIQRMNFFRPSVPTIGINRGDIVRRAAFFSQRTWGRLSFEDLPPKYLAKHSRPNAYTLRFIDVINEVTQIKKELLARHKPEYDARVHAFIDTMARKMDEQVEKLQSILKHQQLNPSDSILATTVRWWVLKMMTQRKNKIAEIQSLGHAFEDFIRDYKTGMTNEEWKYRIEDLDDRRYQIFEIEPEPIIIKPSVSAIILTALKNLPFLQACFSQQPAVPAEPPAREMVALTDPSRGFHDQNDELGEIFLQLRLLNVDSHAVLDIYDHLGTDITVVAGHLHIKNISQYLSELGIEQKDCDVRDPAQNDPPLDLNELPL